MKKGRCSELALHRDIENNPVAKVIIEELIQRKKKASQLEGSRNRTSIGLILLFIALLIFGVDTAHSGILGTPFKLTTYGMLLLACMMFIVLRLLALQKKVDKAEDELEELREELIERSEDLWKQDEHWSTRKKVFDYILSVYGINLYFR